MKKIKGLFKGKGAESSPSTSKNTGLVQKNGYDVKEKDLPKLHKAAWNGDLNKVKSLAKKDVNSLDKENRTPLHLACVQGHATVVQELLEWHANPNKGDHVNKTPLMKAVECNQEECVKLLLEYRTEVDARDRDGNTALHLAVKEGHTNIVALLISAGSNLNLKSKEGYTPLHLSVLDTSKRDDIAKLLLENGASPNEVDRGSRTPLHHACQEDSINHVKLLLKYNANTFVKDSKGWTAEDCAMMKANHGCSQLVYDHNLKQQKKTPGGSVQSTPRNPPSIAQSTPRESSASDMFGLPQAQVAHDDDESDEGTSKMSGTVDNPESWADDTDVSSAMDDHRKKAAPKISLTKNVKLDDDESEPENQGNDGRHETGQKDRVVYSRTPTPTSPGKTPSPSFGALGSKIPVRKHTPVDGYNDDDDDDDDSSPLQRNRVSFKETEDVRQFASQTDDDTDIDDDEGEEPMKKRRLQEPGEETPYLPSGLSSQPTNTISEEKRRGPGNEYMKSLGFEEGNEVADVSDFDDEVDEEDDEISDDAKSPRESNQLTGSQQNTPRGILKQPKNLNDKPPSVHHQVESDEEESDWDSTKYSDAEKQLSNREPVTGSGHVVEVHSGDESPEVDSDLEDTLNPEHSNMEKTSQWDSTEGEYTPRTPREDTKLQNKAMSPEVKDFEFEDEDEDEIDDHIEEAVTAFNTSSPAQQTYTPSIPSYQTPEPTSDSSHQRTHSTPDPPTTSTSAAVRTVIIAEREEPIRAQAPQKQEQNGDSDWDSEEEVQSDEEAQEEFGVAIMQQNETPRTARSQTSHTASDEESASEWELERQREKQKQEEADRLLREEEERDRREEEMRKLAELEEEEERQRQWEEDERRRQEQLEREAQAELEREIRESQEISDVSDFVDDEDDILPDDDKQSKPLDNKYELSDHQDSEKSEPTEEIVRSHNSDRSNPLSPRNRELKKPPPKLNVFKFMQPSKEGKNPVQMGEIENESPAFLNVSSPGPNDEEDVIEPVQQFANQSRPGFTDIIEPVQQFQNHSMPPASDFEGDKDEELIEDLNGDIKHDDAEDSDQDVDGFAEYEQEVIVEEKIKPVEKPSEQSSVFLTQAELPKQDPPLLKENDESLDLLNIPAPKVPLSAPPKAMSLQSDGHSPDEEDDIDSPRSNKPSSSPFNLPDYSGTTGLYRSGLEIPFDDDGLSVTSTENGDISTSYRPENLPYGKDMLVNMNLSDSNAVLKLQEHLREHRRQLEHERGQRMLVENKHQLITKEKVQLQKSIDSLKYQKSVLEQNKLDLEAKIRNLEYQVNEEEEKRKNSELLLKKTKDHLAKKEEQFSQEMEAKQRAELAMRNIQTELRAAQNQIKDLEEEKAELDRLLTNEKNARHLQEKINDEQQRLQQYINEEALKTSSQREDDGENAEAALELAGVDIKQAKDMIEKLRNENAAFKAEIQRQRLRLTEENSSLTAENEKLQQRVEDLKNEVRLNEEALTQYTVQQNLHHSKLASESTMLNNSLDKERVAREKLEAELESSKNRLHATVIELEKSQQARNEFERRLHADREEWGRQLERKDQELTSIKEKLNSLMHTLNETESKLNSVENELHISNTTLLERTNQHQQQQRDLQYYKTAQENYDSNLRHEKEQNAKMLGKVESLQDRLSSLQHDNLSLKQQVELANQAANDRSGVELQEKLNTMIGNLKADHEKARGSLEEKNNTLQDTIGRLREEVRNSENRRNSLEQDIRRLNQEQNDLIRKLSIAEASLDVAQKARDHLEQERVALKMDLEKLQQRYQTAQEKTIEAQTRMTELADRLDKTEQSRLMSNQQLADTSATMAAFNNSKSELEENYQKLQVDNVRLEAELKHEKQKAELLNRDLLDSQKIAQLEKHKQETYSQLEEERRKTRKALEQKRLAESKLESEQEKCLNLQKEVANLKAYLKVAKKRLKELGGDDNNVETGYTDKASVEEAKRDIEARYRMELNRKLDEVNSYLEEQARTRNRLDTSRDEQESKLRTDKKKLEEEVTDLRIRYEQAAAKLESKETEAKRFRDLYESEMQWRMRLSEQLYRSTDKVFAFKNNAERQRNRMYGSLSNLTMNPVNGHAIDLSRLNEDALGNKLRAELDRSIAKHLEAAPHEQIHPLIRGEDPALASSNFAKANAEYFELLKRKYCV